MNARRMFDALVQKRGVALKPKLEINEIHTLLHLVRTGRWVAILVDSIIHGETGLCAVPFREAALPMPVVWLYPKGMYIRNAIPYIIQEAPACISAGRGLAVLKWNHIMTPRWPW